MAPYSSKPLGWVRGYPTKYINGHNRKFGTFDNPQYRGGRTIDKNGYAQIKCEDHPRADSRGYVYEHLLIAEVELGRRIRVDENIHHINGDNSDNSPSNIIVLDSFSTHMKVHWEERKRKANA